METDRQPTVTMVKGFKAIFDFHSPTSADAPQQRFRQLDLQRTWMLYRKEEPGCGIGRNRSRGTGCLGRGEFGIEEDGLIEGQSIICGGLADVFPFSGEIRGEG